MLALAFLAAGVCVGIVLTVLGLRDGMLVDSLLITGLVLLTVSLVGSLATAVTAMIMGGSLGNVPGPVRHCSWIGIIAGLGPVNVVLGVVAFFVAAKVDPWVLAPGAAD